MLQIIGAQSSASKKNEAQKKSNPCDINWQIAIPDMLSGSNNIHGIDNALKNETNNKK